MNDDARTDQHQLDTAPTLARIQRLQFDRHYRDSHGLFFAEGVRNFVHAVDHRFSLDTLVYSERLLISPLARKLVRRLKRAGVPFARVSPEQFRSVAQLRWWVRTHKIEVIRASPDGSEDYDRVRYRSPALLILGTERSGLTEEQRRICQRIVRIPMVDGMDSLNLAVAGSLLMYQVFRSRSR